MTSPADDIAHFLESEGHGVFGSETTWAIAVAREPATPDGVITVYDTPGNNPHPDANNMESPAVQVRVRGGAYPAVYAKAQDCKQSLIVPKSLTLGTKHYVGIWAVDDIGLLRFDENNRPVVVVNFTIIREDL